MGIEVSNGYRVKTRILFFCASNTCRSPIAQAIFEKKISLMGLDKYLEVDSAGSSEVEVAQKPDSRSQHAAAFRGYKLIGQEARSVTPDDFEQCDLILVMDWQDLRMLQRISPKKHHHKIELVMRYSHNFEDAEVSDPYNQNQQAFKVVVDYLDDAVSGLIDVLKRRFSQVQAA